MILCLEPVGSVSPKLHSGNDQKHMNGHLSSDITLMSCSAQAFPVPVFRWVGIDHSTSKFQLAFVRRSLFMLHPQSNPRECSGNSFEKFSILNVLESLTKMKIFFLLRTNWFCCTEDKHCWPCLSQLWGKWPDHQSCLPSTSLPNPSFSVRNFCLCRESHKSLEAVVGLRTSFLLVSLLLLQQFLSNVEQWILFP